MWKKMSRIARVFLLAMLLWSVCATALAIDPFDPKVPLSLTVHFSTNNGETIKEPITVNVYSVAQIRNTLVEKFLMRPQFAQFEDDFAQAFKTGTAEKWWEIAQNMADYVASYRDESGNTFEEKYARECFSKTAEPKDGKLKITTIPSNIPAIYLVVVDKFISDKVYYEMAPQLVSLPSHPVVNGVQNKEEWIYDVEIKGKLEIHDRTDLLDVTVYKEWDDEGWAASSRPANITITLYADGKKHDTITLPQTKDGKKIWNYTWTKLNPDITWTVKETKPANYTPQYSPANGKLKKVTSTKYESTITNYRPPKSTDSTLPQTGLNWWPVAVLAVAGMVLVFLGWLARRADEESEEA